MVPPVEVPAATTLAWTTNHGAQLEIFKLNAAGQPLLPALLSTTTPAAVASGNLPLIAENGLNESLYVLTNGAGATTEAVVEVPVRMVGATPAQANAPANHRW